MTRTLLLSFLVLTGCGGGEATSLCDLNQTAMLGRVADLRGKPIVWSHVLAQAAQAHAQDLAATNIPSHTGTDGSTHIVRAIRAGWHNNYVGENLTVGPVDQGGAIESWENSPGHRINLDNKNFTHLGAACVSTGNGYGTYWVQVLGGNP